MIIARSKEVKRKVKKTISSPSTLKTSPQTFFDLKNFFRPKLFSSTFKFKRAIASLEKAVALHFFFETLGIQRTRFIRTIVIFGATLGSNCIIMNDARSSSRGRDALPGLSSTGGPDKYSTM